MSRRVPVIFFHYVSIVHLRRYMISAMDMFLAMAGCALIVGGSLERIAGNLRIE